MKRGMCTFVVNTRMERSERGISIPTYTRSQILGFFADSGAEGGPCFRVISTYYFGGGYFIPEVKLPDLRKVFTWPFH